MIHGARYLRAPYSNSVIHLFIRRVSCKKQSWQISKLYLLNYSAVVQIFCQNTASVLYTKLIGGLTVEKDVNLLEKRFERTTKMIDLLAGLTLFRR